MITAHRNFSILILWLLFFQLNLFSFGQKGNDEYSASITQADNFFKNGDYINAKTSYQYASRLRPSEQYPKTKLQETINRIREKMVVVDQFTAIVAEADREFRADDFEKASLKYKEAKKILPEDPYPDQQLNEIKRMTEEKAAKENEYSAAIANGEKFIKYRKYEQAKAEFENATLAKPGESYPQEKISELTLLIEETNKVKAAYSETLVQADRLYNLKYYKDARSEYEKALNARPDEEYPAERIKEIEKILIQRTEYDRLVSLADEAYGNKNMETAKTNYQAALKIYPDENYPKTMIDKVNASLSTSGGKEELYQKAVADASEFYESKDFANALMEYENASRIKPSEQLPVQKIAEIKAMMQKQTDDALQFNQSIQKGEQLLAQKDYSAAKIEFTKATQLKPDESYPKEKLTVIEDYLRDQEKNQSDFDKIIVSAEKYENNKQYDLALAEYQKALVIFPDNKTVLERIDEINKVKSNLSQKDIEVSELIANAGLLFDKGSYSQAKSAYAEILEIDPLNKQATERIAEIEKIQADNREIENSYSKAIFAADIYFKNGEFEKAKAEFQKASLLKPAEKYPSDKLAELENLLGQPQGQQNSYDQIIASADKLFSEGKYELAKKEYQKALDLKPNEKYPAEKIAEINKLIQGTGNEDKDYEDAIKQADELFNLKKYTESNLMYMKAANIKTKGTISQGQDA